MDQEQRARTSTITIEERALGWSSYAACGLRARVRAPGGAGLGSFPFAGIERIAAGGRLVVVLPGTADDGLTGFQDLFDHAKRDARGDGAEGAIMAEGRARMVVGSFPGGNAAYSLRSCMLARPALCLIYAHLQPFEKLGCCR